MCPSESFNIHHFNIEHSYPHPPLKQRIHNAAVVVWKYCTTKTWPRPPPLITSNVFAQNALVALFKTTLFLGQLISPRYTLPQNVLVSSRFQWNALGNYNRYRPARFPPLLTGNFRIARPVAMLSTPRDEGANPGHRYFRSIGHPHVSLCRGRRSTGMRSVPVSSWNGFPSQRSDEAPVLADQENMQEPRPLHRLPRRCRDGQQEKPTRSSSNYDCPASANRYS